MSSRRARIKAVASLPPRRKNTETADKNKQQKDISDKITKSPRTPKVDTVNQEQNINKSSTSTENENFASPLHRVQVSNSPKQTFASPIIPSPKVNKSLGLQKPATPQRNIPTPFPKKINENSELQISETIISNVSHNSKPETSNGIHLDNDLDKSMDITENISEEAMDGIVPLQPVNSLHKPIDLLKSEIISENAEVLFDPIVPLPSPTKVRPKLRPAPRLGPHRRNSIQGSASESEDESRRNLVSSSSRQRHDSNTSHSTHQSVPNREVSRVRNDSVCSSASQVTAQLPPTGSPLKDKQNNKTKRQEVSRRMATMRRRRENVKRDTLTMYDLIFYNPTSNPIVPDEDEIKIKEANAREELERSKMKEVVEPEPPTTNTAPVPQIKLGPQGEIILDEESLVIKQTDSGRKITSVVHEGAWGNNNGYKYKRGPRAAEWSAAETVRFYRALAAIGTDFTLMAPLFPDRTRKELKIKFKKEEKLNGAQVDKALRAKVPWDVVKLRDEFKEDRTAAIKRAEEERERLQKEKKAERERLKAARDMRVRQSRGAKALESTMFSGMSSHHKDAITAEDIIERAQQSKPQRKRKCNTETSTEETSTLSLAKLTPVSRAQSQNNQSEVNVPKMAIPNLQIKTPDIINCIPQIPSNIETGSLVVLTVNDPSSPTKKMLQTYIAHGPGKLTPVALPPVLLNSVVGYMKKNTPKSTYSPSSQIMSPSSVTSHDSRTSSTLSGISVLPSPTQRQRHNSFTITQL